MLRLARALAACLYMLFAAAAAAAPTVPPNALVVTADDASCHFGVYGCPWAATLRAELFAELRRQADPRILGRGDSFDNYPSPKKP